MPEAGLVYTAVMDEVSITNANTPQDLFEISTPAGISCFILEIRLSVLEVVATEKRLVQWHRGTATGSGGGTITPSPHDEAAAASGITVERNNTTQSVQTGLLGGVYWNPINDLLLLPVPKGRWYVPPSQFFIVSLGTDFTADPITMSGSVTYLELG